jgi:uncharacterized membrane protein YgdD (TMEM256/DUF423 family)
MAETNRRIAVLAALSAAMAVAAAAFGAHGAGTPKAASWLETGGHYQLTHALAALLFSRWPGLARPALMLLAGSVLFALTLYLMAIGAPRWFGAITPIGGVLMIGGWLWAAWLLARND